MKAIGCLLLVSGWLIVLAAVVMLAALAQRSAFMAAGLGVEILGLSLLAQAYKSQQRGAK